MRLPSEAVTPLNDLVWQCARRKAPKFRRLRSESLNGDVTGAGICDCATDLARLFRTRVSQPHPRDLVAEVISLTRWPAGRCAELCVGDGRGPVTRRQKSLGCVIRIVSTWAPDNSAVPRVHLVTCGIGAVADASQTNVIRHVRLQRCSCGDILWHYANCKGTVNNSACIHCKRECWVRQSVAHFDERFTLYLIRAFSEAILRT